MAGTKTLEHPLLEDQSFDDPLHAAEYARRNGLTVDVYCDPFTFPPALFKALEQESTDSNGLTPCNDLPDISLPSATPITEQWEVSGNALRSLRDVCQRYTEVEVKDLTFQTIQHNAGNARRLKLELPVLRTDHDMDYRAYVRTVNAARDTRLLDSHLPLEPANTEKDEGLEFPARVYQLDRQITKAVAGERLEMTRTTLQCLAGNLKSDWTDENTRQLLEIETDYHGITAKQPPTPPISPRHQAKEYYIPDNDVCKVPILSDASSRLSEELQAIEERIFECDNDSWLADAQLLDELERGQVSDLSVGLGPVHEMSDLKVEVPLMPQDKDDEDLIRPSANFGDFKDWVDLPVSDSDGKLDEVRCDEELGQILQDIEARTMMSIEQEKLQPVDATARVPVPLMDFSIPDPEWNESRCDPKMMFEWIRTRNWGGAETPVWPGNRLVESRMVWVPWTQRIPTFSSEEKIKANDIVLEAYLARAEDTEVPNSSNFVWKRPGLAALGDDEDDDEDDELEPALNQLPPVEEDLMMAVKRRKRLLDERTDGLQAPQKPPNGCNADGKPALLIGDEPGAASKLLDNYMELHAPKKPKLTHSSFFKPPREDPVLPVKPSGETAPQPDTTLRTLANMPCPQINLPGTPLRLIASVSIPRGILRRLEQLLSGAELIDRDYNAYNSSIWLPGSVCRSEVTSPLADEADLIVSPSTGILLTTMIKVRQKPLPGTKGNSPLYSFIEKVSVRYERLIIVVSEGLAYDDMATAGLPPADAMALARFQGFATSLETQAHVFYIAGGEENLAKWTAHMACRYAADAATRQYLLQRESNWELFLRRSGMNVHAAQVVLGMLKDANTVIGGQRFCGLAAFIKMSDVERVARFGRILGGTWVLQRVSRVIDRDWDQELGAGKGAGCLPGRGC